MQPTHPPADPLSGIVLPSFDPLITAAVEPLSKNAEQKLAASEMLRETADPEHPEAASAIARWKQMDAKKHPGAWKTILYALAAISFVALVIIGISINQEVRTIRSLTTFDPLVRSPLPKGLTPSEKLLLGDPEKSMLARKEALHRSDPDRPDFYAEYAGAYIQENRKLPPGYLETVARIDPDNSFFLYIAAGSIGAESFSPLPSKGTGSGSPRMRDGVRLQPVPAETEWEITDEADFSAAIDLIEKASLLPRYDSYETSMAEKRVPLFNQDTFVGRIQAITTSAMQTSPAIFLMKTSKVLQASAYLHSVAGDAEGFLQDHRMAEAFLRQIGESPPSTLVGELVFGAIADSTTRARYHGAERMGMGELSEILGKKKDAFQESNDLRRVRNGNASATLVETEGSMMQRLVLPMLASLVSDPPDLRSEDFTAGRLADHDLASSLAASALFATALLAGLCALLFQLRATQSVRILAGRFTQLLTPRDWTWILVAGILLPFAVIISISTLTPLGGRSMSLSRMGFLFPFVHYAILLLFLLTLTPLVIHWRMAKHSGAFSLGFQVGKLPVVFLILGILVALAAYPLVAWNTKLRADQAYMILVGPLGLWLLFIVVGALRAVFGKQALRLRRAVVARAMLPALALAMIIPAVALPLFLASAQKHIAQDRLTRVALRGFSSYEAEVADLKRKEVNAILAQ